MTQPPIDISQEVPLQTATGQWVDGQDDNQWIVKDANGEVLAKLPRNLKDQQVMNIIRFGRKFEKNAYFKGYEVGQQAAMTVAAIRENKLKQHIKMLEIQNDGLASALERHIIGEDEE